MSSSTNRSTPEFPSDLDWVSAAVSASHITALHKMRIADGTIPVVDMVRCGMLFSQHERGGKNQSGGGQA